MKNVLRFLAVAAAGVSALAFSGSAFAAYTTPRLEIVNPVERVGAGGPPTGTIDGVWRLELSAAGQTLIVPMYVQRVTAGPEATFASAKLTTCLPSPYPEAGPARATLGAKLVNATLVLPSLFSNPAAGGTYLWRSIWTPYTPNSASPNAAGTVEAQAADAIPTQLTARARARARRITVSGSLLANRAGVRGARIQIFAGRTARRLSRVATVSTNARGVYTARIRWRRPGRVFIRARVVVPARVQSGCAAATNPAVQCLRTVVDGYTLVSNRTVRVRR